MTPKRDSIYRFAECDCGGVFQSREPLDNDRLASWEWVSHGATGHVVTHVFPPVLVAEWSNGRMNYFAPTAVSDVSTQETK